MERAYAAEGRKDDRRVIGMTNSIWLWLFIGSSVGLLVFLFRAKVGWSWIGTMAVNVAAAGVVLYLLGLIEPYTGFHLPINAITLATVAALGLPGLAALVGLQLLVM